VISVPFLCVMYGIQKQALYVIIALSES